MTSRIERVTYRSGRGTRTVFLDVQADGRILRGVEVDSEASPVEPSAAYLKKHGAETGNVVHIIDAELVTKRTPMVTDHLYGHLVPAGTATQETDQ